jgi:hypothetical protein
LVNDPEGLAEYLKNPERAQIFTRNYELISFRSWTDEERMEMTSTSPVQDWDGVRTKFDEFGFKSITKDGSWEKFFGSFQHLWG